MHDAFQWWSEIWIPALIGAASTTVAVAAFLSSRRAMVLANKFRSEEEHRQLLVMARDDARALQRWVSLSRTGLGWMVLRQGEQNLTPPERDPGVARREAEAAMMQSLVPNAAELLALTSFDVAHWYTREDVQGNSRTGGEPIDANLVARRTERCVSRIRDWARDPEGSAAMLDRDSVRIATDRDGYLWFE